MAPNEPTRTATTFELAVVGGGNMGAALVGGLLGAGTIDRHEVVIVEALDDRRDELALLFAGVAIAASLPSCRAAVLAVKPGDVADAARDAVRAGARRLLSIAAGVPTRSIERAVVEIVAGGAAADPDAEAVDRVAVVRAMPNTPALVGQGASAIAGGAAAADADLAWAEGILGGVGLVVRVDESQLDAVTALSGSGPAYVFLVAEALVEAGVQAGLPPVLATALTTQLLVGSAALLAERGDPAALRAMVTSPGGTTAAGLAVLDERDLRDAFVAAVAAAAQRSRELAPRD